MRRFESWWRRLLSALRRGPAPGTRGPDDVPVVQLDYDGAPVWIYATSKIERTVRAAACAKEPWTVRWIEAELTKGGVLYDIGANVGVFSLLAAAVCESDLTVFAFEPGYASFGRLCENISLNGAEATVIPIPLPLWSSNRILQFAYRSVLPGKARHRLRRQSKKARAGRAHYEQPVLGTRLDDLVRLYKLPLPNHIKVDVDGAEVQVLSGASDVLNQPDLRTLMVESEPEHEASVIELLNASGFSVDVRYQRTTTAPSYTLFRRH